ncbi:MAG: RNA 2',3'-cyclic phosphodiesterase [bacterium]
MRAFLAITLPDEIKARLAATVQRLAPLAIEAKWYTQDQFHLTLAFLGEVSPAILPHVAAAADRVCSALPAFTCQAEGLGFFGTKRNPKSLWAGVAPTLELMTLHEKLWKELKKFGYENDGDEFHPHITFGRCRESARNHPVVEALDSAEGSDFGEWKVTRVTLFESRLTPRGPIYRTLGHSALAEA